MVHPSFPNNYTTSQLLTYAKFPLVITDLNLPDNPIVFANDAFEQTTGYNRTAILGRNCRFLQGEDTDEEAVARIRLAVENRREIVEILKKGLSQMFETSRMAGCG